MKVLNNLKNTIENFRAGSISSHFSSWAKITSDKWLLDIVRKGYDIEFESDPCKPVSSNQPSFSKKETFIISQEITKLVQMKVLTAVVPCAGQFLSNIFLVPKHDGGHRLILNLKHLNEFVEKHHFKMETLKLHWHWLNQMLSLGVSIYVKHIIVFRFVVSVGSFYALFGMVLFTNTPLCQMVFVLGLECLRNY